MQSVSKTFLDFFLDCVELVLLLSLPLPASRTPSALVEYRDRIELLQDFNFPTYCNKLKYTRDGKYLIATGAP